MKEIEIFSNWKLEIGQSRDRSDSDKETTTCWYREDCGQPVWVKKIGWVVAWGTAPTQGQVNVDAKGQWQVGKWHPEKMLQLKLTVLMIPDRGAMSCLDALE